MKKQKPSNLLRLLHIRDAIELIREFIEGYDFEQFSSDKKTISAVQKQIEIVGEAVYHLDKVIKDQYTEIEWVKIEGTRHKLVHDYYEIRVDVIWQISTINIPQLYQSILSIIEALQTEE